MRLDCWMWASQMDKRQRVASLGRCEPVVHWHRNPGLVRLFGGRKLSLETLLSRVAERTRARARTPEAPLRAELFSVEQLVRHATALAQVHRTVRRRGANELLARLAQNEQILRAYNRVTQTVGQTRQVTHAAEWLLDNFYLIEEQIQMARRHLPRGYSRELPQLGKGHRPVFPVFTTWCLS